MSDSSSRTRISEAVAAALPQPPPPLRATLRDLEVLCHPLPVDLLAIARSSSAQSEAVAHALGVRAAILTSNIAGDNLAEWIRALGPFVKAVSFYDVETLNYWCWDSRRIRTIVSAFKAMDCSNVALRTLDATNIPFKSANDAEKEELREGLVGALRSNKVTIQELAMPLTESCLSALREVLLPNLKVLQLNPPIDYRKGDESDGWLGCNYLEVFKVVEEHLKDRGSSHERGGLELRIKYFEPKHVDLNLDLDPDLDLIRHQPVAAAFCQVVRTLEIGGWVWLAKEEEDKITSFVSLFPRIKCFRWGGTVSSKMMRTIERACPELTELHLVGEQSCREENITDLLQVLEIAGGKLRSLCLKGPMSTELVTLLGRTNPGLHMFSAEIGPDDVAPLLPLLQTYCRDLHSLHVHIFNPDEEEQRCFRADGWRRFSQVVQSASPQLRDVVVECGSEQGPAEPDVNDLVDSVASVLESLKDRARIVKFHVIAAVAEYGVMMGVLSRLLTVGSANCSNLEQLSIRFHVADVDLTWNSDKEKESECRKLLWAKHRLKNVATRLHYLELDLIDAVAEETLCMDENGE